VIDLDHPVQALCDLAQREIVPMKTPERVAARGAGVMADSIAGEKSGHVWVRDLRFQLLQIEVGVRPVDAGGAPACSGRGNRRRPFEKIIRASANGS
jgi:hypothetical protein